eukprot:COSAG01_NODE_1605_length_9753_cov_46.460798_3_plen_59_part_00
MYSIFNILCTHLFIYLALSLVTFRTYPQRCYGRRGGIGKRRFTFAVILSYIAAYINWK